MYYKHIITGDIVQLLAYDGSDAIYEKQKPQFIGKLAEYRFRKPRRVFEKLYRPYETR